MHINCRSATNHNSAIPANRHQLHPPQTSLGEGQPALARLGRGDRIVGIPIDSAQPSPAISLKARLPTLPEASLGG